MTIVTEGEVEILLNAQCQRNWGKLWPHRLLGSYASTGMVQIQNVSYD